MNDKTLTEIEKNTGHTARAPCKRPVALERGIISNKDISKREEERLKHDKEMETRFAKIFEEISSSLINISGGVIWVKIGVIAGTIISAIFGLLKLLGK